MPTAHLTATAPGAAYSSPASTASTADSPPVSPASVGLDTLAQAVTAHIVALESAGPDAPADVLMRLMEIGFLPGERVRVIARGFGGGEPLAVRVGQATFALRRREAALVRVQALQGAL